MTLPEDGRRLKPYKGLGTYGPEDADLFAGREQDTAEFAELVARADVRLVLLHGATGCGKSSFLRAGVIPYLEESQAGFAFLKDPNDPAVRPDDMAAKAVFIRSTARPLEMLAQAVFRLADRGYEFESRDGRTSLTFPAAKRGCTSAEEFAARVSGAPQELVAALETLSGMPHKLVLVVDQAEEVFTLRGQASRDGHADAFFTFLNAFAATRWRLTLIVSLRTDFFGVFHSHLRRDAREGVVSAHDYYLDELSRADMIRAIVQPTLDTPTSGLGAPRERFQFSFEEGLPARIANDLATIADTRGLVIGVLPLLQVVCDSLYKNTEHRNGPGEPWQIVDDDYVPRPELDTIARYVDDVLDAFLRKRVRGEMAVDVARSHWKEVLTSLVKTRPDGSVTTELRTAGELRAVTNKVDEHFDDMLAYLAADEQSVLRRDPSTHQASTADSERYSLRHDAVGLVFRSWLSYRDHYRQQLVANDVMRQSMPSVEQLELKCTFDESGSGEHLRRWVNLRCPHTVLDYRIPYGFGVSEPGCVIVPAHGVVSPMHEPASILSVRFVEEASTKRSLRGYIEVCGQLGPTTGFVGFEIRHRFERAFLMSRSAVEEAYQGEEWQTEYVGIYVQMPTRTLRLSVVFPPTFNSPRLKIGPVVFFGSGEKPHEAEIARIQPNLKRDGTAVVLDISDPLPGLQYGIYWMPPK